MSSDVVSLFIDNPELGEQYLVELEKAATLLGYNLDEIFGFAPNLANEEQALDTFFPWS